VTAGGVGQSGYADERLQELAAEKAAAGPATCRVAPEGLELVGLAVRAGEGMQPGCESVFHLLVVSELLGLTLLIMPHEFGFDIIRMSDFF